MTARDLFDAALREVRAFYENAPALTEFSPFPEPSELKWIEIEPFHINPADLMAKDKSLVSETFPAVRDALIALKDFASWRETYRDTNIGKDFLGRFGCFELFGLEGHYRCENSRGFIVYSNANLYYPWHHHPAEEIYFILAGEAEFATEGNSPRMLKPGDSVFHAENQPHNMKTKDCGVLAWVQWRGDLTTAPVLTDRLNV